MILKQAATGLRTARGRLDTALGSAADAARQAHADGMPETQIARELGVNRLTVRRWLGK